MTASSPVQALFRRLILINGLVFTVGTLFLAVSPATVSSPVLLRRSLAPLGELTTLMRRVDLLRSSDRLTESGNGDLTDLVATFNAMLDRLEAERSTAAAHALAAQEGERQRIARELHDEIGQSLTVALLSLKRVADRAPEELHEEAEFAQAAVRDSLEDVRQVARRLRPGVLADLGLRVALKELAADVARTGRIDINRSMPRELPEIGGEAELVIYRVAQEALTNVVRHARASHADLSIVVKEDRVVLRVSDDGHGGDYVEGVGIRGMRERAALVGAELSVSTNSVGGTEVRLVVPRPSEGRSRR